MPGRDGTGPMGEGPFTGGGFGSCLRSYGSGGLKLGFGNYSIRGRGRGCRFGPGRAKRGAGFSGTGFRRAR